MQNQGQFYKKSCCAEEISWEGGFFGFAQTSKNEWSWAVFPQKLLERKRKGQIQPCCQSNYQQGAADGIVYIKNKGWEFNFEEGKSLSFSWAEWVEDEHKGTVKSEQNVETRVEWVFFIEGRELDVEEGVVKAEEEKAGIIGSANQRQFTDQQFSLRGGVEKSDDAVEPKFHQQTVELIVHPSVDRIYKQVDRQNNSIKTETLIEIE